MADPVTLAVVGLGVSGASAYMGHQAQSASAKRQKEAARVEANQAKIQQAIQRRNEARQTAIKNAAMANAAARAGLGGSSGVVGAIGGSDTIQAGNTGTYMGALRTSDVLTGLNRQIANYNTRASMWGAFGTLGSSITSVGLSRIPQGGITTQAQGEATFAPQAAQKEPSLFSYKAPPRNNPTGMRDYTGWGT